MFTSESYTLQNNTTIDKQIISAGEFVVKEQYICSMQENTIWFWDKHPQHQVVTVSKCTIIHPRLVVIVITDIHDIFKSVSTRTQAKKSISIHPICLTDSYYNTYDKKLAMETKLSLK